WKDDQGRPLLGIIPLNMAREILLVLGSDNDAYLSFCPHGAGRDISRSETLRPYLDEKGRVASSRVEQAVADATSGLDIRWFHGEPDITESPVGYKDAAKVKAQIDRFGLATLVGE